MARMHQWRGMAAIGISLTGCVSQEKYNAVKLLADQRAQELAQAQADSERDRTAAEAYKSQLDEIANGTNTKDAMLANDSQQISALTGQLADIRAKYDEELNKSPQVVMMGGATALPAALSNELSQFAADNPDLVDFDARRGIVKFKSDVTFPPGSTDVNPRAKEVLAQFARILNTGVAANYELMVAGHTDNTPITRAATIKRGNYDNWYLSAHRAIAVAAELVGNGVRKTRLGVAGYADQRPIASNATESGKAQNRRVEVLILPTQVGSGEVADSGEAAPRHAAHRIAPDLNKDTENAPAPARTEALNK
jgi:chemotaxis protein MotB